MNLYVLVSVFFHQFVYYKYFLKVIQQWITVQMHYHKNFDLIIPKQQILTATIIMKKFLHLFPIKAAGLLTSFVFLLAFANAQVVNTTHPANSPYATIQAAINDAITFNGDIITVGSGTYNESINITKSVNLRGVRADICAINRTGAESIISCPNGIGVNASNVTINGFTIQNQDGANAALAPGFGFAVYMVPPNTGTQLLNNIIRNNTLGTGLSNAGASPAQVKISCNWFDANNTPGPIFREAIYADDDISGGTVKNVLIDNNKFSNHIEGVGIDFEMSTAASAATGITMTNNIFDGNLRAVTFYNVASSTFSNNEIKNSTFGVTSADLRIFGGANNLIVHNNSFDGSNEAAPHAIRMTAVIGPNANVSISENSFTGYSTNNSVFLSPQNYTGGAIPATCNWFGTTDAATIASLMGSPVSYIPYLTNGTDASPARGFQPVPASCNGTNQSPSIICPQNITVYCGDEIPNPDVESVTVSGSCPGISVTWEGDEVINQTCVSTFTILRTYKATDACGNIATCTQIITVVDNIPPTLTVPANVSLQCTDPTPLMPLTINSSPNFIDGTYNVGTAVFGAPLTATPLMADAVMVIDNGGNPYDACDSIINNLTGKIAVIERSGCTAPTGYFVNKAYKAQLAGAVGVIFISNQAGDYVFNMGLPAGPNPTITIPLMLVSHTYGASLKSELLAGPVNVSLSAPTVIANDACSFTSITYLQTFTPGNCPSNYTLVNTWTATDQCGNATTASQTITVADNTPPTLTVPANVTLQCSDPLPLMPLNINSSPNFIDGTYNVGTAVFGAPLTATPLTADAVMVIDNAGNPYDACDTITNDLTGKIAVIERSGCTPPNSYFVTKAYKAQQAGAVGVIFIFNQTGNYVATMGLPAGPNPTITIPLMLVSHTYGATLKAEILAGPVNVSLSAPTVIANDICSFVAITQQQTYTPGNCPSNYTLVNTWTATDQCGNATSASQTITVADNTPPTLTVPANVTLQCTDPLPLKPVNINSSPNFIDGTYNFGYATFGPPLSATPVTGDLELVNDGAGTTSDACETIINSLAGKIAVIDRGFCSAPTRFFLNRTKKAQDAGAIAVIFVNNAPGNTIVNMGPPPGPNPPITIPAIMVSYDYGNSLKSEMLLGAVNASLSQQTVIAEDLCSFVTIDFTETVLPGTCDGNYNVIRTWSAKDVCNNATTKSQTISVVDNTAPTITAPANITLTCVDPLPLEPVHINSATSVANTYNIGKAVFGPPLSATPVTGNLALVNDGAGNTSDACETITNNLTGKIAVLDRGGCAAPLGFFINKVANAQAAGAIAVIVVNNVPGDAVFSMGVPAGPNPTITIPAIMVSNNYGNSLKTAMLLNTVNVSLSAQTVLVSDACSNFVITHTENFVPGNCGGNYSIIRTWTATDNCGNAATASQTILFIDTTPPTLTVPANVTLQCTDPLPQMPLNINSSTNFIDGTYNVGTAVFGAPLTATPLSADAILVNDGGGGAGNPYDACESIINNLTGKIAVIERSGCTPPAGYFVNKAYKAQLAGAVGVIFISNQPGDYVFNMGLPAGPNPTITIPLMLVSHTYGASLKSELLSGDVNVSLSAPTVMASDVCSFAAITYQQTYTAGNCPSNYTLVNTWTATDECGNATTKSQTITVADTTRPTLTVPASVSLQCTDPIPQMPLTINSSPNFIDGTYNIGTAVFGAPLTATPLTADAVMAIDNAGNPYDACDSIINDLTGKIAVIERSGCTPPAGYFVNKAYKAQQAGAVGVIFISNQPGDYIFNMGLPAGPNPTITIPLMLVSHTYGATLKAEILAGPVNVSLSAPTVTASDVCSFAAITYQQTFTAGNCPSNYTLVNTWTATDQCGNATTKSQTITVADSTPPTLTVPANVTLQCTDPTPLQPLNINSSPNFIDGTYNVGTAVFGAPLTATPLTADAVMAIDNAGNPYDACDSIINNLTGKIAVIERSGCTPPTGYFVTKAYKAQLAGAVGVIFISNQAGDYIFNMGLPAGPNPTITIPLMLVSHTYGATLKSEILAGPVNVSLSAPTVTASDVCSFVAITHQQTYTPGGCGNNFTIVNTWTATDQCGNATSASQTVTSVDNTAPTLIVPANATLQCNAPLPLQPLHINSSPNSLASTYNVGTAVFGAPLTTTPITANTVMVNDGAGGAGNPYDACESIINSLTGKIAVIERSGCTPPAGYFVNKAYKAQLAGAVGVIFISNVAGNYVFNMGLPAGPNPTITIPLMLVSNSYGSALKAGILAGPVNLSLSAQTVTASDACSFVTITDNTTTIPGSCPSNYTLVKTWTATDQCGNATTKSQVITVVDNTAPVVTKGTIASCYTTVAAAQAAAIAATTATDNCSNALTKTASTSGTCSAVITVTVADGCGNSASVTYNTRIDNTPPTVTAGTIASCFTTVAAAQAAAIAATTATDNCPGALTKTASTSGTCSAVIIVTVTDGCGNSATRTYNTRIDNTPPTVTAGTIGSCYTTVAAAQAAAIAATTATDNCPGTLTKTASISGTCSAVIIVTVVDGCGNSASVTYNTRIDNTPPTVTAGTIGSCYTTVAAAQAAAIAATTATDNCPGTLSKTASTSGTCSAVITVTVTDGCGKTASVTYNTRIDNTPPIVTAGTIGSCYTTVAAAQAAAIAATTATDNCPGTLTKTASTSGTCSAVVIVTVTDGCGNSASVTYNTRIDNTPPTVTAGTIGSCYTTVAAAQAAAIAATTATDNCPGSLTKTASTSGTCSAVITVTVTDGCGNSATKTYNTRIDNTPPVVTCKANQTRLTNNGYCTYAAIGTEFNVLSATDNCPGDVGLSYTLSGATSGSGINTLNGSTFNTGITTVTWKATDGCGNIATCSFNITVNDDQNSTGYIIYAKSYAKFGEENDINGDIGVTDAIGSAEFKKNTNLNPFFVKAKNISVQLPANVSNRFYTPATGGPNPPFMIYNGSGGSGTLNANVNGTYNGNYKNLTVKAGITATFTGNDFGKINIEEGANVTFTAPVINLQELSVAKGKKNVNTTNVYFANPTSVKIFDKVTVEEDCMINVNGPKVTFYLGDNNKDEEKFIVTGDNTMITLNIMIPNGKLKVSGGPRYGIMTGWFITEKIESNGSRTIWNKYDCSGLPQFARVSSENVEPQIKEKPIEIETPVVADVFAVKIYPNPTPGDFNIQVITKSNEPIMVRIMDVNGRLVQASTKLTKQGLIAMTNKLPGGTYFVEVTQGKNHSVTKLVKLN